MPSSAAPPCRPALLRGRRCPCVSPRREHACLRVPVVLRERAGVLVERACGIELDATDDAEDALAWVLFRPRDFSCGDQDGEPI